MTNKKDWKLHNIIQLLSVVPYIYIYICICACVERVKGGVHLGYIRVSDGVVEDLVHIDVIESH